MTILRIKICSKTLRNCELLGKGSVKVIKASVNRNSLNANVTLWSLVAQLFCLLLQ